MVSIRKAIGDLLVDNGQITPEELEQAEAEKIKTGEPIGSILSKMGFVTENSLKNALELQYGVNYINLAKREPEEELIALLPEDLIRKELAVPVSLQGERLTIAMVDPGDLAALDEVKKKLDGRLVKTVVCLEEEFFKFLDRAFAVEEKSGNNGSKESHAETPAETSAEADPETALHAPAQVPDALVQVPEVPEVPELPEVPEAPATPNDKAGQLNKSEESSQLYSDQPVFDTQEMRARPAPGAAEATEIVDINEPATDSEQVEEPPQATKPDTLDTFNEVDLAKRAQEEAIVLLANQILGSAIKRHCSNIHIQMRARESIVYYRLNGRLIIDRKLPNTVVTALVARYKMMARLNLAERQEPQDGHIKVKSASKEIVCLISVMPTDHGENIVIWIV
jgi:type II secretory ATPase GspE/PulE/Tfp pilus assembly ATPase PilB-like protein